MKQFIKELFSDLPGVSFGRMATFISLLAAIGWVTRVVWQTNAIPALDGITLFVASFYAGGKLIGKAAEVLGKKDSKGGD